MTATCITLPWPARGLHPNSRGHWAIRARLAKAYRADAMELAMPTNPALPDEGPIPVRIVFCAPDNRPRDLDGALSSIKAGLDGIADALHVNDRRFRPSLEWGAVRKGGAVEVWL